jgi:hypothetical protein
VLETSFESGEDKVTRHVAAYPARRLLRSAFFVTVSSDREGEEKQRLALCHVWDKIRSRHRHTIISSGLGNDDIESDMKDLRADLDPKYISRIENEQKEILSKVSNNLR